MKKKRLKFYVASILVATLILYQDSISFVKNNPHMVNIYEKPKRGSTIIASHNLGPTRTLRHGNNIFAKTPYVNPRQALSDMPRLHPGIYEKGLPSHVDLCQELLQRNKIAQHHKDAMAARARKLNENNYDPGKDEPLPPPPIFTKYIVNESPHLCKDYKHPHSALMQIISSSIIAYVGKRFGLHYEHACHSSIDDQCIHECDPNVDLDFDITTIQQIFPQATMPVNERELSLGHVVHKLCPICIEEYKSESQLGTPSYQQKMHQQSHHSLAFPHLQDVHKDTIRVQQFNEDHPEMPDIMMKQDVLDQDGHLVRTGLGAVLPLVKNRINHAAMDWASRAHIPSHDPRSGAVIYFDAGDSIAIPFWILQQYIDRDTTTHVSILTGPDCAKENLRSLNSDAGVSCIKYALGKCSSGSSMKYLLQHAHQPIHISLNIL